MCQKTFPKVTNQRTETADEKPKNDLPDDDVIQNPYLEMGSINRAVSMEMIDDAGYTKLQRPSDCYEKIQAPQNPVREIQEYPEYRVNGDQSDVYEVVSD